MSRKVRRVPLDFDWPVGKVWGGYLMPAELHEAECGDCAGEGYGVEARAIAHTFYPHMFGPYSEDSKALAWHDKLGQAEVDNLIAEGRLRVWRDGEWKTEPRTADEINAQNRRGGIDGHDAINRHILIRFRCERLGITVECPTCSGHGYVEKYPGQRKASEQWEATEPPAGDGWQLWETVSEGSPVTPVLATAEALIDHLATFGQNHGGPMRRAAAEALVSAGSSLASMMVVGGVLYDSARDADKLGEALR